MAIWEDISMDFILSLPKSNGYVAILVVWTNLASTAILFPSNIPTLQEL